MFKCSGNCIKCDKCNNIYDEQISKKILLPDDFQFDSQLDSFGVAFDIGTTTIVGALWSLEDGKLLCKKGADNPQRQFGADVLSRISYAIGNHEHIYNLQHPLRMTIRSMIIEMCKEVDVNLDQISKATFCGNTAMMLFFAGMSIDGIASYPFTPDHIDGMVVNSKFDNYNIAGYMLPNIGGHIGGDISAGLISTRLDKINQNSLFMDIGTNGEILLKVDNKIYGFSTAAGPAFEGANISHGMSATLGAIENFEFTNDEIRYSTIGNKGPIGMCGSGIISAISEMLKKNIIDTDGKLRSYDEFTRLNPFSKLREHIREDAFILAYSDNNKKIIINQKDIREFQLAKAAIKAGIELLLKEGDTDINDITHLFLAGGFGVNTPLEDLIQIGILPNIAINKIKLIGNSALTGASMVLMSNKEKEYCSEVSQNVTRVELSSRKDFQDEFLNALKFTI